MSIIELSFDGEDSIKRLIKIKEKMEDMTPINREISEKMVRSTKLNFNTQGARLGKRWKGLAESTKERRKKSQIRIRDDSGKHVRYKSGKRKGQYKTKRVKPTWPGKILIVSSGLIGSVVAYYGTDYAGVGTNKVYGRIHQLGGKAGKNRTVEIEARPFFGLSEEDKQDIRKFVGKEIFKL